MSETNSLHSLARSPAVHRRDVGRRPRIGLDRAGLPRAGLLLSSKKKQTTGTHTPRRVEGARPKEHV